jgi:hypothetical protein
MSRHRGAKHHRRCGRLGGISLLSLEYLLFVERWPFHTENHRITLTDFRLCSTCQSCSQASLCQYTLNLISDQIELTIARLRYNLGGDRPSQTTRHTGSLLWITEKVRHQK